MNDSSSTTIVLLTGAGGLLGRRLAEAAPNEYRLYRHYHRAPAGGENDASFAGNLDDPDHVRGLADMIDPGIIINSAALADVDRCETEPELSYRANVTAVRNLLDTFPEAKFVQISTDYVFSDDERRGEALPKVGDATDPVNVYGKHKLEAERIVLAASPNHLIVRVNSLFDFRGRTNIFSHVLKSLTEGKRIVAYTDQISNPISAVSAAEITVALIQKGAKGIFHVGGREVVSREEFARRIGDYFELNTDLIEAASSAERSRPAQRPVRAGLECRLTELFLNRPMPSLNDDFACLQSEMEI